MAETFSKEQIRKAATRALGADLGNPDVVIPPVSDTSRSSDNQTPINIRRGGVRMENQKKRTEAEVQELIADIPDGASITLKSPKGAPHTYFREEGKFYLESEKDAKRKIDQTYRVRNRLRFQTCTIESTVPLVIEPVPPVALADPALAIAPIPDPMPPQASDAPKPSDVPSVVNATELQNVGTQPTEAEIEAVQKEKESYVSGDVFAEQILAEQDAQVNNSVSLASQSKDNSQTSLDALDAFAFQPQISEAVERGIEPKDEFAAVQDFDELFAALLGKPDGIQSSKHLYSFSELWRLINHFRVGTIGIDNIPPEAGLQDTVQRLFKEEQRLLTEKQLANLGKSAETMAERNADARLKKEKQDFENKIKQLEQELDVLRKDYVKKNYEETSTQDRLVGFFRRKFKEFTQQKAVVEGGKYKEKLLELSLARLDFLKKFTGESEKLKQLMVDGIDSVEKHANSEVYNAWTDVQAEKRGLSEKILEFGRKYNKLPLWKKVAIGGAVWGVAGVATAGALGAYGIASATMIAGAKRGVAAGGLFATFEAYLEKKSRESFGNTKANQKANLAQVESIIEQVQSPEERMEKYQELIRGKIEALDANLASRVGNRDRRRVAALFGAIGASFGLVAAWDYLHGAESVSTGEASGAAKGVASATTVAAESEAPAPEKGREWMLKPKQLQGAPQASVDAQAGVAPAPPSAVAEAVKPSVEVPILADTALAEHTKLIDTFVNQDITVQKGDSVWKISGRMADQMKLTGGARTHFIDALKDKFGDIQLQAGETINFGAKGIDREFIEKALGKSGALTAEQIHSIEANDAKIAAYASANPDITLTNEGVDQILHSNPSGGSFATDVTGSRMQFVPQSGASAESVSGVDDSGSSDATTEQLKTEVSTLKQELSGVRELANATAMQPRVEGWIGPMLSAVPEGGSLQPSVTIAEFKKIPLRDIQYAMTHDSADAYERVHMTRDQFANVKQFIQGVEKDRLVPPLNDVMNRMPDLKIGDYITKIALDPKVKIGYMIGGRGGFSTSI